MLVLGIVGVVVCQVVGPVRVDDGQPGRGRDRRRDGGRLGGGSEANVGADPGDGRRARRPCSVRAARGVVLVVPPGCRVRWARAAVHLEAAEAAGVTRPVTCSSRSTPAAGPGHRGERQDRLATRSTSAARAPPRASLNVRGQPCPQRLVAVEPGEVAVAAAALTAARKSHDVVPGGGGGATYSDSRVASIAPSRSRDAGVERGQPAEVLPDGQGQPDRRRPEVGRGRPRRRAPPASAAGEAGRAGPGRARRTCRRRSRRSACRAS